MTASQMILAKAQVSRHLSRPLPYYLTPAEVHQLIDAADNERDRLLLRVLWETVFGLVKRSRSHLKKMLEETVLLP